MRASFQTSYDALPAQPDAVPPARAFRLLALAPGPTVSLPAAAALLDRPVRETEAALEVLVDAHLLDAPQAGRYDFHDLMRAYAGERATAEEPEEVRTAVVRRVLTWYIRTAAAADLVFEPNRPRRLDAYRAPAEPRLTFADRAESARWYEAELDNLLTAVHRAGDLGAPDLAVQLAIVLFTFLGFRGYWRELVGVAEAGAAAARATGDRFGLADNLNHLGIGLTDCARTADAIEALRASLAIRRELGDLSGEAAATGNLGNVYHAIGRYDDAVECFRQTLAIAYRTGNTSQQARSLSNIAYAHNEMERFAEAAACAEEALSVAEANGDRLAVATAQPHLARAYHGLGRYAEARARYAVAIADAAALGLRVVHGLSLMGLGDLEQDLGDPTAARRHWRAAHVILVELGDVRAPGAAARLAG